MLEALKQKNLLYLLNEQEVSNFVGYKGREQLVSRTIAEIDLIKYSFQDKVHL